MTCEKCGKEGATKSLRVEPKTNPQLGTSTLACDECIALLKARYDNRSDRQVYVEDASQKRKSAWFGMTGLS